MRSGSWLPIEEAAPLLGLSPVALRARCRRASTRHDGLRVVAELGAGVLAVKLGRRWRVLVS